VNFNEIQKELFKIKSENDFNKIALAVFKYQYNQIDTYKSYCDLLKKTPENVFKVEEIPFLPIQFFKTYKLHNKYETVDKIFQSSGTTGNQTSKHFVTDINLYKESFIKGFDIDYENLRNCSIIGLLPSYLERKDSSLIYMVNYLINNSNITNSKFQLDISDDFINYLEQSKEPKIMFGVTFALLDLAEKGVKPKNTIILETGGMKGRGKEVTRTELHKILQNELEPKAIHSEYGMTELLSQAYLKNKTFNCPPWMKISLRDATDPLSHQKSGKGVINVIDLANLNSCSFIATDDLGKLNTDGSFEVLGRLDNAQIRGCNLLI
jgi:phenylacetate-coenzyme A ligase PaaK-like adenylate-forming protein